MTKVVIRLDPGRLENPDLDIRYALPDLLVERSGGVLADDGYDYVGGPPYLLILMATSNPEEGVACVLDLIETCRVLGNNLREAVTVGINRGEGYEVVFPVGFRDAFPVQGDRHQAPVEVDRFKYESDVPTGRLEWVKRRSGFH